MSENYKDSKEAEAFEMDEEIAVKEKLNPEGEGSSPSKVKFTASTSDSKNGEAKIDINGYGGPVGMTKDELMKYANDPFWVRLRMFLFILFWVIWFAMLVGAIFIIAVAPKCPATSSLPWWQKTTIYQVYVRSFKDSNGDGFGDIQGVINKLDYLQEIGVNTILLSPIYPSPNRDFGYDVSDYVNIDPLYGDFQDFDKLVEELHSEKRDMKLIIDFIPNHSSNKHPWFNKSIERVDGYDDYYVWHNGTYNKVTGRPEPPNNWRNVFDGPAWTFDENRSQWYLHQFLPTQPDLNLRNERVKNELKEVLQFWLKKKVDGVRIDAVSHLYEAQDFGDEPEIEGQPKQKYNSLNHTKTKSQPENFEILRDWRKIVKQIGLKNVLISEAYEPVDNIMNYYHSHSDQIIDLPLNFQFLDLGRESNAQKLLNLINSWTQKLQSLDWPSDAKPPGPWSAWVTGNHDRSRLASRVGQRLVDAVHMVTFLLPRNTPVVYFGDEIGIEDVPNIPDRISNKGESSRLPFRSPMQWNTINTRAGFSDNKESDIWLNVSPSYTQYNVEAEDANRTSHLKVFKALTKLRKTHPECILLGETHFPKHEDNDVFIMVRSYEGSDGFLVAVNFNSKEEKNIKLEETSYLPKHGKVIITNSEVFGSTPNVDEHIDFSNFRIGAVQAIVVQFSPKE